MLGVGDTALCNYTGNSIGINAAQKVQDLMRIYVRGKEPTWGCWEGPPFKSDLGKLRPES